MKINLHLPYWLLHHALTAGTLLWLACLPVSDIRERHWSLDIASGTAFTLALLLYALAFLHLRLTDECEACSRVTPRARRPHYRAAAWCGRYGLFVLAPALAAFALGMPFISGDPDPQLHLWHEAPLAAAALLLSAYLAARRIYLLCDPAAAQRRELHTWLTQNAQNAVHRGPRLSLAAMILFLVTIPLPADGVWGAVNSLALLLVVGAWYLERRHALSLCERCVVEFRTDAPEYAAARAWRFTASHRVMQFGNPVMLAGVLAGVWLPDPWGDLTMILTYSGVIAANAFMQFHIRYRPWCPLCYGGGGGGGHDEPAPAPTGGHGRPVPVA